MRRLPGLLVCCVLVLCSCSDDQTANRQSQLDPQPVSTTDDAAETESAPSLRPPELLPREEFEAGWIQLFDGQTLFGWKANSETGWQVKDGVITAAAAEPMGLLVTTSPFADYEFRCEYRLEEGGNSGVFLRTPIEPQDPATDCYELNMCDSHPAFPTGSLVGRRKVEGVDGEGEWHAWHVTVEGPRVTAKLDGQTVLDFTDESENPLQVGRIGLQKNEGRIEFRNVT
ncbi:MAG: 3-keto-disaccharide hydrolase, partial [Planctomycetaceae bacterium]